MLEWAVKGASEAAGAYDAMLQRTMRLEAATQSYNMMLQRSIQVESQAARASLLAADADAKQSLALEALAGDLDNAIDKAERFEAAMRKAGGIPAAPSGGLNVATQGVAESSSFGRSRLSRIGSELRQLPSIGIPGAGFGTDSIANVLRVGGAIQEVSTNFASFLPILGAVGVAVGAFTAAMLLLSRANEEGARTIRAVMASQEAYYRALLSNDQNAMHSARERAQLDAQIAQARIEENKRFLNALDEADPIGFTRAIADIFNLSGAKELREQTTALETQLLNAQVAAARFGAELEKYGDTENALLPTQAEDLALHQEAIDLRVEAAGITMENARTELEALKQRRFALAQELSYLHDNESEIWRVFNESTDEAARDAARVMLMRLAEIPRELEGITGTLIPKAEELVAVSDAIGRSFEAAARHLELLGTAAQGVADRTMDYFEALKALQDAEDEHADKLADINQKLTDAQVEAAYDRDRALEDAAYDAEQRRNEITEEAGEARVKLEEDTERKRRQIERRFNRSMLNAIGERDALAAYQAEQRRDDELADLEESYDEQEATIKRRLEEQRRTIDRNLENQQRTIQRRYDDQLRTANIAHQRALQQEAQRWSAELQMRQAAYQQALMDLDNLLQAQAAILLDASDEFLTGMANQAADALGTVFSAAAGASSDQSQVGSGSAGDNTIVPPEFQYHYAAGGRFSAFQAMRVGENGAETVIFDRSGYVANANATSRMSQGGSGNSANITINMDGRSLRAASRREAVRYVGEMLGDLEIE